MLTSINRLRISFFINMEFLKMNKQIFNSSILALVMLLTACSNNETPNTSESTEAAQAQAENQQTATKIGDTITFDKEAEIVIKSAEYTDERNEFADSKPLHVLKVTYDVKNLTEQDYVVGNEVNLYVNGKKMETYPIDVTFETISAGRSFENAVQGFAITEEGNYELEVTPSISFTAKPVVIPFVVN